MQQSQEIAEAGGNLLATLKAVLTYEDDRPAPGTTGAELYARAEALVARLEASPPPSEEPGELTCPNTGAHLATLTAAKSADVFAVMAGEHSAPVWVRLANGDLFLAVAPRSETYELASQHA